MCIHIIAGAVRECRSNGTGEESCGQSQLGLRVRINPNTASPCIDNDMYLLINNAALVSRVNTAWVHIYNHIFEYILESTCIYVYIRYSWRITSVRRRRDGRGEWRAKPGKIEGALFTHSL